MVFCYHNCSDLLWEKFVLVSQGTEAKKSESQKTFSWLTFLGLITLEKFKITLEQIIQTVKGHNNYGNRIFF